MLIIFGRAISKWKILLLAGDVCLYSLSVVASLWLTPHTRQAPLVFLASNKLHFFLLGLVYLLVNYIADLYDYQSDYRRWWHISQVLLAVVVGALINIVLFYFPLGPFVGRTLLLIQLPLFAALLVMWRYAFSAVALSNHLQKRILIVGAGACGQCILQAIRKRTRSGLLPVGFLDDDSCKLNTEIDGLPVLGDTAMLPELIRHSGADLIVVAITHKKSSQLIKTLTRVSWNGVQVIDMPDFYEYLAGKVPVDHISDVWLWFNGMNKNRFYCRSLKRLMDLTLAGLIFFLTAPSFLVISLAIKLDSRGPVFFRQERLGYEGRPFRIFKFRTMIQDAESDGPAFAVAGDSRITRVGHLLRKLRLDEIPQVLNVFKGDMSIIGPRPEREMFVREFNEKIPYYSHRLMVRPGITGWAQVMYPYASSLEQTKEKLQYDLFYLKNQGFFLDMAIVLKTLRVVLFGRGT